jgi:hypothetical protein
MAAEGEGRMDAAAALFSEAWRVSANDYEACIAAHYLARHQATAEDALWWNQEALRRADAALDSLVEPFYPSLYLNVADSFERLGRNLEAYRHYTLAVTHVAAFPAGGYAAMIRESAGRGQERTREAEKLAKDPS